ncbi:MAG TPA: glutaredoxin family protein [Natronosporangium sp.]|nr:glutaredoxin family protein [Natronosporangium sp.]
MLAATSSLREVPVPDDVRITLLTRPGCHLCEPAREAVARVGAAAGVRWVEVDVESDPELEREYGGRVPVVLLDGREHCYFRVEEDRLLRDLSAGG